MCLITSDKSLLTKKTIVLNREVLHKLLQDRTTGRRLRWATDNYEDDGIQYKSSSPIAIHLTHKIKPRIEKSIQEQRRRSEQKAEVFTPSWVCNCQNNLIDNAWFKQEGIFNREIEYGWQTNESAVIFPEGKTWQDYVLDVRLEVSCGEAPYLVSRYDTVNGKYIPVKDRIGLLDRKLRVVNENTTTEEEWHLWAKKAVQSTYGYDWQGDNVVLARENLLFTVIEFFEDKFEKQLQDERLLPYADIISWNVWQMDGLKYVVPESCVEIPSEQYSLFEESPEMVMCPGCKYNDPYLHTGTYCIIKDWKNKKKIRFIDLLERRN